MSKLQAPSVRAVWCADALGACATIRDGGRHRGIRESALRHGAMVARMRGSGRPAGKPRPEFHRYAELELPPDLRPWEKKSDERTLHVCPIARIRQSATLANALTISLM